MQTEISTFGHAVNKVLKDITIKFQTLIGKDAPYVPWLGTATVFRLNLMLKKKHGKNSDPRKKIKKHLLRHVENTHKLKLISKKQTLFDWVFWETGKIHIYL